MLDTATADRIIDLEHFARLANDEGDYDECRRYLAEVYVLDNDAYQYAADQRALTAACNAAFLEHVLGLEDHVCGPLCRD